jgi:hypothetical protein
VSDLRSECLRAGAATAWREVFAKLDWSAIRIGDGLVLAAIALCTSGNSVK